MILKVAHVEVEGQNLFKIDEKSKSKMGCVLATIFDGFWWVWGGKLASKIEPRSRKMAPKRHLKNDENLKGSKPRDDAAIPQP